MFLPELGRVLGLKPQTSSGVLGKAEVLGSLFPPHHNLITSEVWAHTQQLGHGTSKAEGLSPATVITVKVVFAVDQSFPLITGTAERHGGLLLNSVALKKTRNFRGLAGIFLSFLSFSFYM